MKGNTSGSEFCMRANLTSLREQEVSCHVYRTIVLHAF